jgi:hypothetical protein
MTDMAEETNWHKHVAIGTYILVGLTAALIVLGILTFTHPPDPLHPTSFDFLSQSLTISPWLGTLTILLAIIISVLITRWRVSRRVALPIAQPSAGPNPIDTGNLFEIHLPTLDDRPGPEKDVKCPAKLRFSLRNNIAQSVHVQPLKWLMGPGNVSLQCGAAPYPGQVYKPGEQEVGYFYQLEDHLGSWKRDLWKMKGPNNREHDEQKEILVPSGWTFRVWIGMNPCVPEADLKKRLKVNQLGTLILPLLVGDQPCEWRTEF